MQPYIGSGILYLGKKGSGLSDRGNVSQLELSTTEDKKTQQNFRGGGGNYDATSQITDVTVNITFNDFTPENLELTLRGTITDVAAGTVTSEEHTVYTDAMTPLDYIPDFTDAANTVTVTIDPAGTATPAVQGTDYDLTDQGIKPISGGGISDGDTIGVDYTKLASTIVEALMTSAQEYEGYFEGRNDAQNGKAMGLRLNRIKFGAPQNVSLIGADYGSLQVQADVLYDSVAVAAGKTPYFEMSML